MVDIIEAVHQELHERVAVPVTAPCRARHSAYLMPDEDAETRKKVRQMFQNILKKLGIPPDQVQRSQRAGYCEKTFPDGNLLRLVWELHNEFYTYTTYLIPAKTRRNTEASLIEAFRLPAFPTLGEKLVDLDMMVTPGTKLSREHRAFLGSGAIYGGPVIRGEGRAWTTFQVSETGQGRYVVGAGSLKPGRLGRLVRRLVEVENYYHLVLLPLAEYRAQLPHLRRAERRITAHSEEIAHEIAEGVTNAEKEQGWLVNLTDDLAALIRLTERMRYRLSAADSYYAIIEDRIEWIREEAGEGFQTMHEFLTARVAPAIRSYRNFIERSDALTSQLTLLGNMMRTRVNMNLEKQGLQTMEAMNTRAALQLMLQRTVEGLSLVVLSYYMTGLANYVFKAVAHLVPLPGSPTVWSACTIPLWMALSFFITHRIRSKTKALDPKG